MAVSSLGRRALFMHDHKGAPVQGWVTRVTGYLKPPAGATALQQPLTFCDEHRTVRSAQDAATVRADQFLHMGRITRAHDDQLNGVPVAFKVIQRAAHGIQCADVQVGIPHPQGCKASFHVDRRHPAVHASEGGDPLAGQADRPMA
ncbi:Uncharacterised protein [Mycobacteroides abscessus subsp. abscessus]|nr:Uncharacterised protein [Mycobacteroides abscessus subsp. abscessus]